jgi:hypothetical protein
VATVGSALVVTEAVACDSSSCSLVTRGGNGLLAKHAFRLDLSFRYTDEADGFSGNRSFEPIYRPKVELELGLVYPAFHREIGGHESFLQLDLAYGLGTGTTLLASAPLFSERSYLIAHGGLAQEYGTRGFGDVLVGVRQSLGLRGLVGGFSVKLPTARYRFGGDFDGTILDPTLQPGSGSWDFVSSLQYGGRAPFRIEWSLAGSYQVNTRNDLGYRFGNLGLLAATAHRPVAGPLEASFQLKFVDEARHQFLGEGVPSTGSRIFYLTPGLSLRLPDRTSFYGRFQIPSHRSVNETQLAPSAAFLVGVSKTF